MSVSNLGQSMEFVDEGSQPASQEGGQYNTRMGLSADLSAALERGDNLTEKKANWPFDYYQATAVYPVDYKYWWTPYQLDTGITQFTMMQPVCYANDGMELPADQILNRDFMRQANQMAWQEYFAACRNVAAKRTKVVQSERKRRQRWC